MESISDLIAYLSSDKKRLKREPLWFRGHSSDTYMLIPSIHRGNLRPDINEMDLLKRFKQNALLVLGLNPKEAYEWLFIMRHYGVPTRLLDWTENPLIATYFAVKDDENNGVLWILRPLKLNSLKKSINFDFTKKLPTFEEDDAVMKSYKPTEALWEDKSEVDPIAFMYPRILPRMQAQLSVYTIHHRYKKPIEEVGTQKHVWRYIIPHESKKKIREELEMLGIGEFQLFPEIESIGNYIKRDVLK